MIAGGDLENGRVVLTEAIDYMRENELLVQPVFDVYEMVVTLETFFKKLDHLETVCSQNASKVVECQ